MQTSQPAAVDQCRPLVTPLPVPDSVVNQDTPYTNIPDLDEAYSLPRQSTATLAGPWTPVPLPLPASVLNADEPWQAPASRNISVSNSFEDIALRHGRSNTVESGTITFKNSYYRFNLNINRSCVCGPSSCALT